MALRHILLLGTSSLLVLSACKEATANNARAAELSAAVETVTVSAPVATSERPGLSSESKQFRDWYTTCDNTNQCTAYISSDDHNGFLLVRMDPGPDARAQVYFSLWSPDGGASRTTATIDGQRFTGQTVSEDDGSSYTHITPASDQLLRALSQGHTLQLHRDDGESERVSLSGVAAAFLWIDVRQDRAGTPTALIRKGQRPLSTVPSAPPAPQLVPAPAIAQSNLPSASAPPASLANLAAVKECLADSSDFQKDDYSVDRLGSDQLLWGVPCGAGAYNFSQIYFVTRNDGSQPRQITFPTAGEPIKRLTNSSYSPQSRSLGQFNKGRGIGDCGNMSEWTWTGSSFALKSEISIETCAGVPWDLWPTLWRARD